MQSELIPISALQHYTYCPRQCALIHVERAWEENLYTLRGRRAHETVDLPAAAVREGIRVEYALPVWSDRLRIIGRADVVEFEEDGTPYPIEHKVGPRLARRADEIQLCAQAICLEEMLSRPVPKGALYYRSSRRRREISFTPDLREAVAATVDKVRDLLDRTVLPPPVADARCPDCSLITTCMPFAIQALLQEARGT